MSSSNLVVCILAGGEGKRMRSDIPKVLHLFHEKPMLVRIIETVRELNPAKIIIITGRFHTLIIQTLSKYMDVFGLHFVKQPEPLGTGNAIKCCLDEFDKNANVLILNGDMPLITSNILSNFIDGSNGSCSILSAKFENPHGYGRIVYEKNIEYNSNTDIFSGIVEERDCTEEQKKINIINTGIYYIKGYLLKTFVPLISNNNSQKEYYLTDIVKLIKINSWTIIDTVLLNESNNRFISGVNTPEEMELLL
jgi:UDP-N-acetylglucosamine diphosphorylase/glucosamine-1-phosphate N-acetyltransferase